VLGLWVNAGDGREEVDRFFSDLTGRLKAAKQSRNSAKIPVTLDPNDLLPPCPEEFWRYEGSLTTTLRGDNPESVRWVFYRRPLLVAPEILKGFIEVGHHAKAVQPLNRRFVLSSIGAPTNGDCRYRSGAGETSLHCGASPAASADRGLGQECPRSLLGEWVR
jgi:carbonic anhydrase